MAVSLKTISRPFLLRRIHSLFGLWLVLYLFLHLLTNSQAAFWLSEEGNGFVRMVNSLESLPFLRLIEWVFIFIPLLVHGIWGIRRALSARLNVFPSDGSSPSLRYGRNIGFSFQRWTSWILAFGILAHVVQMRFLQAPEIREEGGKKWFVARVTDDGRLSSMAEKLEVMLEKGPKGVQVLASSPGKAMLFSLRDTFKSPLFCILYSIFVMGAAFHAFYGFWTSLITWGVLLSARSQKACLPICWVGVLGLMFLGLASIWGSFWLTAGK